MNNFKLPHEHFAATIIRAINWLPKKLHKMAACASIAGILWVSIVLPLQSAMDNAAKRIEGVVVPDQSFWGTLILFAASILANEYLSPKPKLENARPTGDGDFKLPTATEGRPIPLLWGRARIDGPNVVWYGDIRQEPIKIKVKTGLWSSKKQTIGYKNYVAWQQVLCRGPGVELHGLWFGDKEVDDGSPLNLTTDTSVIINEQDLFGPDEGGFFGEIEFYTGGASQGVSGFLDTVGRQRVTSAATVTAPRYTLTSHLVISEIAFSGSARGAYVGNSTTIRPLSADIQRIPALFPGQSAGHNAIGSEGDCNPMNVLYEYLTNTEWGMGRSTTEIDTGSSSTFKTASDSMRAEGNGFSMLLDKELEGDEFLKELERHMDGVVYRNLRTKKWEIKLARADYTIGNQPLLDESNSNVIAYTQSSWEDTSNQIQVLYSKRSDDYKESYALAQDMANAQLQGNGTVTTSLIAPVQMRFPGCKTAALATNLAWRELRSQAYPLARATIQVERDKWDLTLGTVIAWTSSRYGFSLLPMRVISIDYGSLDDNGIKLELVQDVFYFEEPSYGVPPSGIWIAPEVDLVAYPANNQKIFEAPRNWWFQNPTNTLFGSPPKALSRRGFYVAAAVRQGNEYQYNLYMDYSGASTDFRSGGVIDSFAELGTLATELTSGVDNPMSTFDITAAPSVDARINDEVTVEELGFQMEHLIQIDNEFMVISTSSYASGTVTVNNVYRGMMDTVQESHSIGATVWFLFMGSGIITGPSNAYPGSIGSSGRAVRLRMATDTEEFTGTVTTVNPGMNNRDIKPYPPAALVFDGGSVGYGTPSLAASGSVANDFGVDISFWRRSLPDGETDYDEVSALLGDDVYSSLDASTEYQVEVRSDPDGANDLVGSVSSWATGNTAINYTRNAFLQFAAIDTTIQVTVRTRYDFVDPATEKNPQTINDLESTYELVYEFVPSSTLAGTYLGNKAVNVQTETHTAAATGTYTCNIGASQATAAIEVNVAGGGWVSVIAATGTTGTFSANATESIVLRRTVSESPNPNFVELTFAATTVAYGVFTS